MHDRRRRFLLATLVLVCTPGIGFAEGVPDSLAARWSRVKSELHVPGMAVVVVRDTGIVRIETLGLRDVERGLPVTPATRFYIASCTKRGLVPGDSGGTPSERQTVHCSWRPTSVKLVNALFESAIGPWNDLRQWKVGGCTDVQVHRC